MPARKRKPAVSKAAALASASQWAENGWARFCKPEKRMAAVAESAPTTRWREEPSSAKARMGNRIVYNPVTTGVPAIFV